MEKIKTEIHKMSLMQWGKKKRDFPGSPVVKTLPFNAGGLGLISVWGVKFPHTLWSKNKKQNQKHKTEATNSIKT